MNYLKQLEMVILELLRKFYYIKVKRVDHLQGLRIILYNFFFFFFVGKFFLIILFLIYSLRRGPGSNVQDSSGYSGLHHAALNGHM